MIKDTIVQAINEQITREMYSSNLYLSMAGYFQSVNLSGFAHWMRIQAQEEMLHANKFFDYLLARGGKTKISAIDEPPFNWDSPLDVFEASYKHEQFVTECIGKIADLTMKESDHATFSMLQWFITEQVEEEANVSEIVEKLRLIADFKGGLIMMDAELKQRVLTPIV